MEDKEAIEILTRLLEKDILNSEEKEAVLTAIGILSWSKLGESRLDKIIKDHKAKRYIALGGIEK
jgi:hypothetical protein